jgi:hypothetical protein
VGGKGKMKRLTNSDKEIPTLIDNEKYWLKAYFKLKDFEDAEEQGLLLRLPCKVGDTVYAPTRNFVSELRIILISIERDNVFFHWRLNTGIYPNLNGFTASDIGKIVFLTKEEAEAKLKEISCFQNGNS